MAFTAEEYGRSVAAPGLVFPDQPYLSVSRCMADSTTDEGGFPVFAVKGEDVKAYATKPEAVEHVKRVVEVTPALKSGETGAAGSKTVTVTIGAKTFSATTTSAETIASIIDDLVAAINNASTGSESFVAVDGTTKITLTAKDYGSSYNAIAITAGSTDDNVEFDESTGVKQTAAGVDAKEGGYFLGIAQRVITHDEYPAGTPVSVVASGMVWVVVGGDVKSGESVGISSAGKFVAYDSNDATQTEIPGAKFMKTAPSGSYAVVVLK